MKQGPTGVNGPDKRAQDVRGVNRAQELCESRGGRPGLPSVINLRFLWTESNTSTNQQGSKATGLVALGSSTILTFHCC